MFGNMIDGYRHSERMAINGMMKRLCTEEDVVHVDMWTTLWGWKKCTLGAVCTLVERGLPPLPNDSQGRLPLDWVKYDI